MNQDESLEREDVEKVFSLFGPITDISIDVSNPTQARVTFENVISGFLAIQALNGVSVNLGSLQKSTLVVAWDSLMLKDEDSEGSNGS